MKNFTLLGRKYVCLLQTASPMTQAIDGRIVRCGIISSCQSAATSDIVKALLVLSQSHVTSALATYGNLPLPIT